MAPRRGEVYFACLDPVFGHEMGGFEARPVVVVSINDINSKTTLVTVVPGTTTVPKRVFMNVVEVRLSLRGDPKSTYLQCHQIRSIEQARLLTREPVARLSPEDLKKVERAVNYCLTLPS